MFWVILGAIAVLSSKYYTAVGSRKLHHRINKVKLDLEHARHRLKEVREEEYETSRAEELAIQRLRFAKEIIDDLRLRLTLSDEPEQVFVVEHKSMSVHF